VECVGDHQGVFTKTDRMSSYEREHSPRDLLGRIGHIDSWWMC
jgi:hypothetical protein